MPKPLLEEEVHRFPHTPLALELLPDHGSALRLRVLWQRGKSVFPVFESTPLRALAEVQYQGQTFPLTLTRVRHTHPDCLSLSGHRKLGADTGIRLRFHVSIVGQPTHQVWTWRFGVNRRARQQPRPDGLPPDTVTLHLPFPPGLPRIVTLETGGANPLVGVCQNKLVASILAHDPNAHLEVRERGIALTLSDATLTHQVLSWEIAVVPASTDVEIHNALWQHAAHYADRMQLVEESAPLLMPLAREAATLLTSSERLEKRGVDRLLYKQGGQYSAIGEGFDAALAACAVLQHHFITGDDAYRRQARLLGQGVCSFQETTTDSPNWGALWDQQRDRKAYVDSEGGDTLSLITTARAVRGLHQLHSHFGTELLHRTAVTAAQWLLLRSDRDGFPQGIRFHAYGAPTATPPYWAVGETLIPLVDTYRATQNETFMKSAIRSIHALEEGLDTGRLQPDQATTEFLASVIEGVLHVSREYESETMHSLAETVATLLRTRRQLDGTFTDPTQPASRLRSTLAGVRAALAMARIDPSQEWLWIAFRALRAAQNLVGDQLSQCAIADLTALATQPLGLLLSIGAAVKNLVADRDRVCIIRGWQTFGPDPSVWEYVQVTAPDGSPVDFLPLVCQHTLQVLIAVLAPAQVSSVLLVKNKRTPLVRNLLTGELDTRATLVPLGDGKEAQIGVFLADT